jgi:hypothetical protein
LKEGLSGGGYLLHCLFRTFARLAKKNKGTAEGENYKVRAGLWRTRTFMFAQAMKRNLDFIVEFPKKLSTEPKLISKQQSSPPKKESQEFKDKVKDIIESE